MKKIFATLTILTLALVQTAPAFASEATSTLSTVKRGEAVRELRKDINEQRKELQDKFKDERKTAENKLKEEKKDLQNKFKDELQKLNDSFKQKRDELRKKLFRRQVNIRGELTTISGATLPATLTVKVSSISPDFHEQWATVSSSTFPTKDSVVTVKIDNKARSVRRFWGKSSLDEFTAGDAIHVVGRLNADGTISASVVQDNSIQATHAVRVGTIASLDTAAKSFTLNAAGSSTLAFIVKTSSATQFKIPGLTTSTFSNLNVGDKVWVRGVVNTRTKVINASVVKVMKSLVTPTSPTSPTSTASSI